MRSFQALNPRDLIPVPPDVVGVAEISSAAAVVAQDWPAGANIVAFGSTAGFWCDMSSTSVAIPSASTAGTTGGNNTERLRDGTFYQIHDSSTGYSITGDGAMSITLSFWTRS